MAAGSIVDYLKSQGKGSSYAERKKLAEQYGITGYSGTSAQNTSLLSMLQKGTQMAPSGQSGQPASGISPNVAAGVAEKIKNQVQGSVQGATINGTGQNSSQSFNKSKTTQGYFDRLQDLEGNRPDDYEESDRVTDYYDRLQDLEGNKPGPYESKYEEQINSILDSILNNKEFSYGSEDLMNDDLYQMYRENYMRQGNMAMRDAMGNAAGLTGGYGSTYASASGQQAYDNYLANLNDTAMQFADRAYDRYRDDIADRYNQMGVVTGLDNTDYGRYRDTVGDYYTDLNYLAGRYDQEYSKDYGQYRDMVSDYYNDLSHAAGMYDTEYGHDFGEYQSDMQQQQWAQEYAFRQSQAAQEQARWEQEMALNREQWEWQKAQAAAKSSGGSSGGGSRRSPKNAKSSGTKKAEWGYVPLTANLSNKLSTGKITDYEALETVMEFMEKGNYTVEEANAAIQDAGIDVQKAMEEEINATVPKIENISDLYRLNEKKGRR